MDRITCPTCGEEHDLGDMQVGFDKPDAWFAVEPDERARRVTRTSDVATIDDAHHFLRGVLEIPVAGEAQPFGWGIWVKVSRADFLRYTSTSDERARAPTEPFAGLIATRLAGYPQTLGVPVIVRPSAADLRPLLDVADESHPLAREQREGIRVERVLEHLSRYMHHGEPEPRGDRSIATLAADGWQLDDAVARFRARDGLYWIPTAEDRAAIRVGELAKLIFAIEASDEAGVAEVHREWMWVEVDHARGAGPEAHFTGILANDPHVPGLTRAGMRVWFQPEHVIDIQRGESRASESRDVLQCAHHGPSQTTYVCRHLTRGSGLGFNRGDDPDNPRPDAWCDACDALLREEGEWNDRAEAEAGVTLICAGCYDAAEARNRTNSASE